MQINDTALIGRHEPHEATSTYCTVLHIAMSAATTRHCKAIFDLQYCTVQYRTVSTIHRALLAQQDIFLIAGANLYHFNTALVVPSDVQEGQDQVRAG